MKGYEEVEEMQKKHDDFNILKKVKELAGIFKTKNCN